MRPLVALACVTALGWASAPVAAGGEPSVGSVSRRVRLVDRFDADDRSSMRHDNTSAFNCRYVAGTTIWSQHAFGRAIDINPVENPYVDGSHVSPRRGRRFLDRADVRPGMIVRGGIVVRAFRRIGWGWAAPGRGPGTTSTCRRTATDRVRGPRPGGASKRAPAHPASNASEHGIMSQAPRKAPGGTAGVYLEGDRVSNRPEGPLLAREEQQLVEGLLAGNEDAVRALYARYARPIFTLGLRLLGSAEAAEELTQDVFLAAWRKAARFDPARGRLSTWLMTIAHNLAVDRLRRETGVTRPHLVLVDEVPEIGWVDEEEPLIERDAAIRALESLSDPEKRLLARAYFGGLTAREIAEADGIPLGTVKTRLRTALIKVRRANQDKERP